MYWKRYAEINKMLNFYEEAESGYKKSVEFGDYELDTFLNWVDILLFLGEFDSAVLVSLQAADNYPDDNKIEYRLAGLYFILQENEKGMFHLTNGLQSKYKNKTILKDLFPTVWKQEKVQKIIEKYKK